MRNSERRVSMIPSEKIILDNLDNLVEYHMAFMIRTVSHLTGKYVSIENDEEFSICRTQ